MPCSDPIPAVCQRQYKATYNLWHRVWSKTLAELDGLKHLYSDEFTRHHFCSVIFYGDDPVALFCYSVIDLTLNVRKNDSWFSSWPPEYLEKISATCTQGLMPAWFCIAPEYRKNCSDHLINFAKLSVETYAKIILHWNFSMGFGTARNDRKVNTLLHDVGGSTCSTAVTHNCEVDHIIMRPEKIKILENNFSNLFQDLWDNRTDHWSKEYAFRLSKAA